MTVRDILNQCQYGKDITEAKTNRENILESIDKEYDIFATSKRIKELSSKLFLEDCAFARPIERMITKFSSVEERLRDGKALSSSYKKMQALSLKEDFDNVVLLISNRREYNKISEKRILGKIVASAKIGIKSINEEVVLKDSENTLFNSYIKEEVAFLNDIL